MTDKLQDVVERWIAKNEVFLQGDGDMIQSSDLRAFLAQYVLCDREPALWTYRINGAHDGISDTLPPDDAYDEGSLVVLHTLAKVPE